MLEPTDDLRETHKELLKVKTLLNPLSRKESLLTLKAKDGIGTNDGVRGLFEWRSHEEYKFDEDTFKKIHPDLHAQFCIKTDVRRFKMCNGTDDDNMEIKEDKK